MSTSVHGTETDRERGREGGEGGEGWREGRERERERERQTDREVGWGRMWSEGQTLRNGTTANTVLHLSQCGPHL